MRNKQGNNFSWAGVKLVGSRDLWKNSKFLEAFFALRRKKRRRIKLFFYGKGHAEIKKHPRVSSLQQNFVFANLVHATVEG
jgi:hypothetical protein